MRKIEIDENELIRLREQDLTNKEIAAHFGVHRRTVDNRIKALGLEPKRSGPKRGERHKHSWKGGVKIVKGYIYIYCPDHPNCTKQRYVSEHRLVMEEKLGRYLLPTEVVHHKDGDRQNNDPNNLEVFQTNGEHLKHELTGKIPNISPEGRKRISEANQERWRRWRIQNRLESDAPSDTQTTDRQT